MGSVIMYQSLSYKTKQFFFVLIKLSIVIGAIYFIYDKITSNPDLEFSEFWSILAINKVFSVKNVVFLIILSSFNWYFEILKWKTLVAFIQRISFYEAFKQSLGALTASLFTPNRIGDYGAKALFYDMPKRKKIMLLNFIGNMLQLSITLIFGFVGLCYFIWDYNIELKPKFLVRLFLILTVIFTLSVLGVKQDKIKIKGIDFDKIWSFVVNVPRRTMLLTWTYSLIRYLIFSFQFYVLIRLFQVDISFFDAMVLITTMYILSSIIPSVFIFDVVIKGSVAVFVFSMIQISTLTILSIVLLMWILNFVLPSMIGSYYVMTFKLKEKSN